MDDEAIGRTECARLYLATGRLVRLLRRNGSGSTGLSHTTLSTLSTVVRHGSPRLGDLAVREDVSQPTMSKIVMTLVDHDLVRRTPDPKDGRALLITATDKGRRVAARLDSTSLAELRRRVARLPPDQIRLLIGALPALEALTSPDEAIDRDE